MDSEIVLDTITLKQILPEDIDFIFQGLSNPQVITYYGVSFATIEETNIQMLWYENLVKTGTGIWWKIVDHKDEFIGACGFNDLEHNKAEIGYWLLPNHWGKGYATKAVKAILKYGEENLLLKQVEAFIDAENISSKKLLQKMGFQLVRSEANAEIKDGRSVTLEIWVKVNLL